MCPLGIEERYSYARDLGSDGSALAQLYRARERASDNLSLSYGSSSVYDFSDPGSALQLVVVVSGKREATRARNGWFERLGLEAWQLRKRTQLQRVRRYEHSQGRYLLYGTMGPESLAFDSNGRGPYTGITDGRVMRWDGPTAGWTTFATLYPNR
ncbi:hypothetical protein L7F22_031092 [Adiantum nelumboides]|nr:hypothetical protein [Adiantum nelumboides]